jgi:hypothetical protein
MKCVLKEHRIGRAGEEGMRDENRKMRPET